MKLLAVLLSLLLLTGCASTMAKLDAVEETVEQKLDLAEDQLEVQIESITPAPASTTALLPEEDAVAIALEHAGLTAEQAETVRVTYEMDDGIPEYEVEFRVGTAEYDYTVHAETGAVLSFEKDD